MHLNESDIPTFDDYLNLSKKQQLDVQAMLIAYYAMIKESDGYTYPVQWLIEQDLVELEEKEAYEACKLYLDTIEYIERLSSEAL